MNKKIGMIAALAVSCFGILNANEIIKIEKTGDLSKSSKVSQLGDLLIVKGSADLFSAKTIKLDPNKKYKLSGDFRLQSGGPVQIFLGYVAQDSNGKTIFPLYVNPVSGSATEIAATVRRGSKVITVKDASKWNKKFAACYIAFHAKDDFSDLPNRSVIQIEKNGIKQNGNVWEITLKQPLKMNMMEGTKVRQHINGATYIWNTGFATLKNQWITRRGVLTGVAKTGNPPNKLWPGTKYVKLIIRVNGKSDSVTEIRGVKVEEVK